MKHVHISTIVLSLLAMLLLGDLVRNDAHTWGWLQVYGTLGAVSVLTLAVRYAWQQLMRGEW